MSSALLTQLLNVEQRGFSELVERLERVCLRPGIDIRLGSEIAAKTREKIRGLGLDVDDTTPEELFHGLKHRLVADEQQLIASISIRKSDSEGLVSQKIAKAVTTLSKREVALSLTPTAIKRVLQSVPPKRTLKLLKLRSLDSVLKREDSRVLYAIATVLENNSWHTQVLAKIKRLNTKDVRWQPVHCVSLSSEWYKKLSATLADQGVLIANNEAGVVCLMPVASANTPGSIMFTAGIGLQSASIVALQSVPHRRQAMLRGYPQTLLNIMDGGAPRLQHVHGLVPHWGLVHQLAASQPSLMELSSDFEPADLYWETTETKLAALAPSMDFWVGSHYLGVAADSGVVSLHVLDVAYAIVAELDFEKRGSEHLQSSLWNEFQLRYFSEDVMSNLLANQITKINAEQQLVA